MNASAGIGTSQNSPRVAVDMALLKQSQDLMKAQGAALLAALPPTMPMGSPASAPSSAGIGQNLDIQA